VLSLSADQKIDYVELPARDLEAVEKFFHETFGWSFFDYTPDYVAFNDGHLSGGFYKSNLRSRTANGATLVALFADDLENTRRKIVSHGGTICREIYYFPGGRRFHFLDPHGNELAVWSND
jgi:predicted enzyme related to lactoylglutathione lyase